MRRTTSAEAARPRPTAAAAISSANSAGCSPLRNYGRELGEKGPAYVREQYGWEVIIPKLRRLIDSL